MNSNFGFHFSFRACSCCVQLWLNCLSSISIFAKKNIFQLTFKFEHPVIGDKSKCKWSLESKSKWNGKVRYKIAAFRICYKSVRSNSGYVNDFLHFYDFLHAQFIFRCLSLSRWCWSVRLQLWKGFASVSRSGSKVFVPN